MSEPQDRIQIQKPIQKEEIPIQVEGQEVAEVTLALCIPRSQTSGVQPEGPLEEGAQPLSRPHPPQETIASAQTQRP